MANTRPRIGFFSRTLHDRTGLELWKGILRRCREQDVSVVTFKGAQLGRDSASILYYALDPKAYDGFITWASSDADDETLHYYGRLGEKPLVCMTFQIPGNPVVLADSKKGMLEIAEHFISVHGYRKIAFVRGPETHIYARERYEGFLEAMRKHDITVDETLISPPMAWGVSDGETAARIFLEERGLKVGRDIEAILTVSDNISIGVLNYLQKQGYQVPKDIALGGYNDTLEARCTNPPLSSVSMPFMKQGEKGVDTILSLLDDELVEDQYFFPANFVLGQSCGCSSMAVEQAACVTDADYTLPESEKRNFWGFKVRPEGTGPKCDEQRWKETVIASILGNIGPEMARLGISDNQVKELTIGMLNAFCDELIGGHKGEFLVALSGVLRQVILLNGQPDLWQNVISIIRSITRDYARCRGVLDHAENLWNQARVMIGETSVRAKEAQYLKTIQTESTLRSVGASLISSYDLEKLMTLLATSLEQLKIPTFYLALYEDCKYTKTNHQCPEWSRLILARNDSGRVTLPADGRRIKTGELVPADLLPQGRQYSFVVESLHFGDVFLGYIVFETGPEEGSIYLSLRDQLSSAIYGAVLLSDRMRVKAMLEETLRQMSGKAEVVSAQSEKINHSVSEISSSMEEVAASIREISGHIETVMENVTNAEKLVVAATGDIGELTQSSAKIGQVVGMINDIAEKTNVLALNAAIEAAHAGESGRGFNVVAKEVKDLAARTVSSTGEIQTIVSRNQQETRETSATIEKTRESIRMISELATSITAAMSQQASATSEISNLLIDASQGTSEISNAIGEIARLGENIKLD